MGGIGKSCTEEETSELSLENELVLARQEMALDTMTHQAKETACAKAGKGACSDPCHFGSHLLMSLGNWTPGSSFAI